MASSGDVRTMDEWARLVQAAGFAAPDKTAFEDPYGVLTARKP